MPTSELKPGHMLMSLDVKTGATREIKLPKQASSLSRDYREYLQTVIDEVRAGTVKLYSIPYPKMELAHLIPKFERPPDPFFDRPATEPETVPMRARVMGIVYRPRLFWLLDDETEQEKRLRELRYPFSGCPLVYPLDARW